MSAKNIFMGLIMVVAAACGVRVPQEAIFVDEYPPIFPFYADSIIIPPNIAPLNFILPDSMSDAVVVISNVAFDTDVATAATDKTVISPTTRKTGTAVTPAAVSIKGNDIRIPEKKWHALCAPSSAVNSAIQTVITVTVYHNNKQYKPLHWFVSPDSIDPYIVYRLVLPTDGVYQTISLNERELSTFKTRPLISNTLTNGNCFNCHSFQNRNGNKMILQMRNPRGLFIKDEDGARTIVPPSIAKIQSTRSNLAIPDENVAQSGLLYSCWHPTQNLIVFSAGGRVPVCFYMPASEEYYYNQAETNSCLITYNGHQWQAITHDTAEYSYPTWHPNGQTLFFVRSTKKPATPYPDGPEWLAEYSFDLCYMRYDTATMTFADTIYTLVRAADFAQEMARQNSDNIGGYNADSESVGRTGSTSNSWGADNGDTKTAIFSNNGIYGQTPPSGGSFGVPRISPDGTFLIATYSRHAGNPIRAYSVLVGVPLVEQSVLLLSHPASSTLLVQPSQQLTSLPANAQSTERTTVAISATNARPAVYAKTVPRLLTEITDLQGHGDSWASFSRNGKWLMFVSKRIDGYYTQVWFAYAGIEPNQTKNISSKPFPLPQKTGYYYKQTPKAFNLPEFTSIPSKNRLLP